jgi:hypothetical protein
LELMALDGAGPDTAATLLVAAGGNPQWLKSEANAVPTYPGRHPCPPPPGRPYATGLEPAATARLSLGPPLGGAQPHASRSQNAGACRPAHRRGQDQEESNEMPQALHRSRDLPRDPTGSWGPSPVRLTEIAASRYAHGLSYVFEPVGDRSPELAGGVFLEEVGSPDGYLRLSRPATTRPA